MRAKKAGETHFEPSIDMALRFTHKCASYLELLEAATATRQTRTTVAIE